MRKLSSMLNADMHLIPSYNIVRQVFELPSQEEVVKAAAYLIGISNGHEGVLSNQGIRNVYNAQHAKDALGIHIPAGDRLNPETERHL